MGELNRDEIVKCLKSALKVKEAVLDSQKVDEFIATLDEDGDGGITFIEFRQLLLIFYADHVGWYVLPGWPCSNIRAPKRRMQARGVVLDADKKEDAWAETPPRSFEIAGGSAAEPCVVHEFV